jgi:hypothetical protein
LELCPTCENSPLCDGCGHPRGDHSRVFVGGAGAGCSRVIGDFQSLTSWRCECRQFEPLEGAIRDATFAQPVPVDTPIASLRVVPRRR